MVFLVGALTLYPALPSRGGSMETPGGLAAARLEDLLARGESTRGV
jgi:hypothetical protein